MHVKWSGDADAYTHEVGMPIWCKGVRARGQQVNRANEGHAGSGSGDCLGLGYACVGRDERDKPYMCGLCGRQAVDGGKTGRIRLLQLMRVEVSIAGYGTLTRTQAHYSMKSGRRHPAPSQTPKHPYTHTYTHMHVHMLLHGTGRCAQSTEQLAQTHG